MAISDKSGHIAIIGTGFSGLCMAIALKKKGIHDFTLFERADDVGGTWRDNTYPGAACDVPSVLYSFSFAQNPNWTRVFPPWSELHTYLRSVAERFDIMRHIRFGTEVSEMRFDDRTLRWELQLSSGESADVSVVVNGSGGLSRPFIPQLTGRESFEGTVFHSARWKHDHDFAGRRVAVIGSGASAIQFVPEIAPRADALYVFQRTPHWIMPRGDAPLPASTRAMFARSPMRQRHRRWKTYWEFESLAWAFLGNRRLIERYRTSALDHLNEQVPDPELRAKVTPDYDPGCKRRLVSDEWYPALQRDNVQLVTDAIAEIRPRSVLTSDGTEHEVDTIVFATGFTATSFLAPMKVFGRGGVELLDAWKNGAATKLGIATSGFPNFYFLNGPNTGLGHNSLVFMLEAQARYIASAISRMRKAGVGAVDLDHRAQTRSYASTQKRMRRTVWASGGCTSWYQSADGRIDTLWPATTVEYWLRTRFFRMSDYGRLTTREG
ncbi:NAD(P)/FAD-dependent oxidoreductase [Streptomyces sp. NBC_00893]|uniref:flavin-containing monooxygenase n=1 Tax=Streptomyces sp. NBC_00893 TaxID=2975862 RepID=UPI00224C8AD0|nr:NAD(P)/FAD-dependent oxidoreductase [Streptomyces sp. NBC_00893]MCX4850625.1 NAD(P)/FAD-dependent oxidoreductase [Streptomyces sp. NBC_00893]